nr:response regulator [Gammaproteobacteria bacterium]
DDAAAAEHINTYFRAAHNIKGAARGVELNAIGEVAHALESLFSTYRDKKTRPGTEVCDAALKSIDTIRNIFIKTQADPNAKFDNGTLIRQLEALTELAAATSSSNNSTATEKKTKSNKAEQPQEKITTSENKSAAEATEKNPAEISDKPATSLSNDFIKVSLEKLTSLTSLGDELQSTKLEVDEFTKYLHKADQKIKILHEICHQMHLHTSPDSDIQNLLNNGIDKIVELENDLSKLSEQLHSSNNQLGLISGNLQDKMRTLRLVPAGTVLRPLLRTARDIARELNKKVDVDLKGEDIEIDRAILELVRDPLVHILRNSIDHGIEASEERKITKKSGVAKIIIKVSNQEGKIIISISDDGRGIDSEIIKKAAIRKHLISQQEAQGLSEKETLNLLFLPGFSTKEIITNVSGRGVGMDVVHNNITQAKGKVTINTKLGEGTQVNLNLPLTLVTDHGMFFSVNNKTFAIPTTAIVRVIETEPQQIQHAEADQIIMVDDTPVPVRKLSNVLNFNTQENDEHNNINLIVIKSDRHQLAIIVDEIIGEREMVIKSLAPPLNNIPNLAGATLAGDGSIILVLNPYQLTQQALSMKTKLQFADNTEETEEQTHILVVDDSITTRSLEANLLSAHGFDVETAVNGEEAWQLLQHHNYDIVVTDVQMPLMDGFELTEHIKQDNRFNELPVIIVTSLEKEADKRRGIEVGADAYITKNQFESKALLQTIQQLIVRPV